MAYRHFRIQVIVRVILLGATMTLSIYLFSSTSLIATPILIVAVLIYQVWSLIHYVERTNQQLTRFLEAIRHHDFSQSFGSLGLGRSFESLYTAFTHVADDFRRARAEKEEQYRYLQTLVEHIGVGIIAFKNDGEIELINHAARRILNTPILKNIESLEQLDPSLPRLLMALEPGQRTLVKVTVEYETLQLAIHATKIRRSSELLTLVSLQNIGSELAEQEMLAWQNLIRVLTHEIMNSVTPIGSLAGSVNDLVRSATSSSEFTNDGKVSTEIMTDLSDALTTIEKRSHGLLHFVEAYRNLTRIPPPDFQLVQAADLFERVGNLFRKQLAENGINFEIQIDPLDLELAVDPDLIEQVLINLMLNSIQALQGRSDGKISARARIERNGKTLVEVSDNGPGIVESAIDKVFVPFFTTKKGGTGIGLALARQIMRLHNGNITVQSTPNDHTRFTLRFS